MRIRAALSNIEPNREHSEITFSTSRSLGKLELNRLISNLLTSSESQFAKKLSATVQEFNSSEWSKSYPNEVPEPYWQAYLAEQLNLEPRSSLPSDQREQASREFRKKNVASYLSICREIGKRKVAYAFSNMVFGISDKCVSDYLSQMHYIFEKSKMSIKEFCTETVSWQIQNEAIHLASKEKRESIKAGAEVSNPERVRRITIALGELTAILQKGSAGKDNHLHSSERGVFHFGETIAMDGSDSEIYSILRDASDAGFLRLKHDGKKIVSFKVHASMAPAFGFSYRGSYYKVAIQKKELFEVLETSNEDELAKIARKISDRISKNQLSTNQPSLFELNYKEEEDNGFEI